MCICLFVQKFEQDQELLEKQIEESKKNIDSLTEETLAAHQRDVKDKFLLFYYFQFSL